MGPVHEQIYLKETNKIIENDQIKINYLIK